MAFVIPGVVSIVCGLLFALYAPRETSAPGKKSVAAGMPLGFPRARLLLMMTLAATSGSLLFNFSTSSNYELLSSKLAGLVQDPARIGLFLAGVYVLASLTQLLIGILLDKVAFKTLYRVVIVAQLMALLLANLTDGWAFYLAQLLFMAAIFGALPFTDAMIVRYVDDTMRSRVAGMRLAVAFGASSLAVWLIGPIVKAAGFSTLIWVMVVTSCITLLVVSQLPGERAGAATAA